MSQMRQPERVPQSLSFLWILPMKTAFDPRHQARRKAVESLFAESFTHQPALNELAKKILAKKKTLDKEIAKAAPTWPIEKLNKIDLAI